jgi:hypothetical protein
MMSKSAKMTRIIGMDPEPEELLPLRSGLVVFLGSVG